VEVANWRSPPGFVNPSPQVRCGRIIFMQFQKTKLPPPPGLVASLAAGFDAVANHVSIIVLPFLLDLLLWLGPHVRIKTLMQPVINGLAASPVPIPTSLPDAAAMQQIWSDALTRFNLFELLRTFPLGIPSLLSSVMPTITPLGAPLNWEVSSFSDLIGSWFVLILSGWLLGSLYFYLVSSVSIAPDPKPSLNRSLLQSLFLSLTWLGLLLLAGIPLLLLFSLLLVLSSSLVQIGLFIFMLLAIWIILPVFFSPHGIFAYQQNAFASILQGMRMIRFTLPTSGLFLLSSLLISEGFGYLWRIPPNNSWLTMVGIAGHAFISTGLLAASFIYYKNINAWLQSVVDQINTKQTPVP